MSDKAKQARTGQLDRIRALMAKTVANGCTEAEAKTAAAAVDRLLALYEIDLDEITVKEQEIVQLGVPGRLHDVSAASLAIAHFTDCRTWYSGNQIIYLGFQVDTEICAYLTAVFMRAIDRESGAYTIMNAEYDELGAQGQSDMLYSFRVGMAVRLGERLGELKSKRDFTQRTHSGRDLVLIKKPLVDAVFNALGLVFGKSTKGRAIRDPGAWAAGRNAAGNVSINQGIATRAQTSGRLK